MTNPIINQFKQTPVVGQMDFSSPGIDLFPARVSSNISSGVTLSPGQAVKGDNATPTSAYDGIFPVLPLANASDPLLGFVKYNLKDINYPVNSRLELATNGAIIYQASDTANSGAIARFSPVEYSTANNDVLAWGGLNPICGYALDAAINAGDLIRIRVASPQLSNVNTTQSPKLLTVTATLAQINAGLVLIPGVTGKKITVTNVFNRSVGAFATGTSVELESTNATPVAVLTYLEAAIGSSANLFPNSSNVTIGAGFCATLGSGDGLQVVNNGTAQTGGTSMTFTIEYTQA